MNDVENKDISGTGLLGSGHYYGEVPRHTSESVLTHDVGPPHLDMGYLDYSYLSLFKSGNN
jgi:hypothetical protein